MTSALKSPLGFIITFDVNDQSDNDEALIARFDPNQPRDSDGQWTETPGSKLSVSKSKVLKGNDAMTAPPKRLRYDYDADTWAAMTPAAKSITDLEIEALDAYTGAGYKKINDELRNRTGDIGKTSKATRRHTEQLDHIFADSALTNDIETFRGVKNGSLVFGDAWKGDLTGASWTEHGFLSTSTSEKVATAFIGEYGESPAVMKIVTPSGTRVLALGDDIDESTLGDKFSDDEAEILFQRGLTLRVTADHGIVDGKRRFDVEVTPANDNAKPNTQQEVAPASTPTTQAGTSSDGLPGDGEGSKAAQAVAIGTKTAGSGGKPVVSAIIYKKHADGAIVGESPGRRMRWDAEAKKFVVEERKGDGWQETTQLTKTAAYEDMKQPGKWLQSGTVELDATPLAQSKPEPTSDTLPDENTQITPPQTPEPTPTVSEPPAKTGEFTQRYDGPRFEFPDNIDQAVMDDFREKMAIDLFESRLIDERAQQLRMDNPDLFPGYSSYEKYKEVVRGELLAEGIISGDSSSDDALTTLYNAMSHISSYDDREAVRKRLHYEASVQAHLTRFADRYDLGPPTPKLKRELAKKLRGEFADKKIAMRVTPKNLEHILRDGRIKSQFETGKSKGMNNQLGRAEYERVMFGINSSITADVEKRPIYGYVAVDGVRPAAYHEGTLGGIGTDALSQYGQVQLIFKDQVRDRTTAMYGDSLNNGAFGLPSPVNQPSWLSLTPMNHKSAITGNLDQLERDPRDLQLRSQIYIEAQIHDGVSTDDIAEVVFPSKPAAAVQSALAERGIPWRVLTLKSGAAADGELGETSRLYAQQQRDYALARMTPIQERITKYQADGHPPGYYEDSTKDLQRLEKLLKEANAALVVK